MGRLCGPRGPGLERTRVDPSACICGQPSVCLAVHMPQPRASAGKSGGEPDRHGTSGLTYTASGLTCGICGLTYAAGGLRGATSGLTYAAGGLAYGISGLTYAASGLTYGASGLTYAANGLTYGISGLTELARQQPSCTIGLCVSVSSPGPVPERPILVADAVLPSFFMGSHEQGRGGKMSNTASCPGVEGHVPDFTGTLKHQHHGQIHS